MINSPCKGCGDRKLGCHTVCEKYLEFSKLNEQERNYVSKQRLNDSIKNFSTKKHR